MPTNSSTQSLTKKFTRDSLKRSNPLHKNHENEDANKAQVIQTEMARARAKSLRTYDRNALQRHSNNNITSRGLHHNQHRALSPYRSFGLHGGKNMDNGASSDGHAKMLHDNSTTHHYNAEILSAMSSLTEPTWAPSMSMDVASNIGGRGRAGSSNHHSNYPTSNSRGISQQEQQETVPEDEYDDCDHGYDVEHKDDEQYAPAADYIEPEDPAMFSTDHQEDGVANNKKTKKVPVAPRPSSAISQEFYESNNMEDRGTSNSNRAHPTVDDRDPAASTGSTRRKNTKEIARNPKRSSSTSSQRSAVSVPIDPRQFVDTASKSSRRSRHHHHGTSSVSSSSKQEDKIVTGSETMSSKRSSSVPPVVSDQEHRNKDEDVDAARAKFQMYERQAKLKGSVNSSVAIQPSNETTESLERNMLHEFQQHALKMSKHEAGEAHIRFDDSISSVSNQHRAAKLLKPSKPNLEKKETTPKNIKPATASTFPISKPSLNKQAPKVSSRGPLRRNHSNLSMYSVQSESLSMASSARMMSSSKSSSSGGVCDIASPTIPTVKSTSATAVNIIPQSPTFDIQRANPATSTLRAATATPSPNNVPKSPIRGIQPAASMSRTQKMMQDSLARSIHKEKSRFHQSMKPPKQDELLQKQPFDEKSTQRQFVDSTNTNKTPSSFFRITSIFWMVKYVLWYFPQDLSTLSWTLVLFFTRQGPWTAHRKTVLLTGASTSMGSEIARQLAMQGARLALVAPSLVELEDLADQCRELGSSKVHVYAADLTNTTCTEMTVSQAVHDFGGQFHTVILNGQAYGQGCYFEEIQDSNEMERILKDNALSCMLTLHFALKHIPKTADSRIVVLSSASGLVSSPYQTIYGASQFALQGFCNALRMELQTSYKRKAPKLCLVSFPAIAGQFQHNHHYHNHRISAHDRMLSMGATLPPTKSYSWAGLPMQRAVHDLLEAISSGRRDFGAPGYVKRWQWLSVMAPSLTEHSIGRHVQKTHYRPLEETSSSGMLLRNRSGGGPLKGGASACGQSVSNKTWM